MHRQRAVLFGCLVALICSGAFAQESATTGPGNGSAAQSATATDGTSAAGDSAGPADAGPSTVDLPDYFYKHLTGAIAGKYRIVMDLSRLGGRLVGAYYYADRGIPLFFGYGSTISQDGTVHIVETNQLEPTGSSDVTGVFDGRFVGQNELRGTWKKSPSSPPLPFAVTTIGLTERTFDIEHLERGYYPRTHGSASMEITYPVMRTGSAETDAAFNSNVLTTTVGLYENGVGSVPPTTATQAMNDFISTFTAQLDQSTTRNYFPPWSYSIDGEVLFNSDGIISVRYESFSFEGGAHPNTVYKNSSYVKATGSEITLDDILQPGYRTRLNAIGLREFKLERGIQQEKNLKDAGYFVSDKDFQLNGNFLITKAGLLFQFNQYEIAPYYFGAQQVLIPYSQLHGLLIPKTPIDSLVAGSANLLGSSSAPESGANGDMTGPGSASSVGGARTQSP